MDSTFIPPSGPQILANFPQPTRPSNYMDSTVEPPPSWVPGDGYTAAEAATREEGEDGDHQTREELQRAILELYNSLPVSLRSRVSLDRFYVPRVRDVLKGLNLDLDPGSTRGVHRTVDELSRKIERFKVKTIQLGGVVKEEDGKNIQAT